MLDLLEALRHERACEGFGLDFDAMKWAHACVLLLPSGNSAHLEAGWFAGKGKPVAVLVPELREPELMYKLFDTRDVWGKRGEHVLPLGEWETPLFATVEEMLPHLAAIAPKQPTLYPCGCSHHKVNIGRCARYKPGEVP